MKKLLLGAILIALVSVPVASTAEVSVGIGISLPPIVIGGPPEVVVLPDTRGVYVVPYLEVDLFFWNGWWWRPYGGGWYRSRYYDRGWGYYSRVPVFYYDVDPYWRRHYSNRHWNDHPWNYRPIPHSQLQSNWKGWQDNRYWEKQRKWDVQGYSAQPQKQRQEVRRQRQVEYQQRPEVKQHQQQRREQQKQQVQQPQKQRQEQQRQQQQHQPQVQQHQGQQQPPKGQSRPQDQQQKGKSQHQESQGKPEKGDAEHRK